MHSGCFRINGNKYSGRHVIFVLWTAALFYREAAVQAAIFSEIGNLVGEESAHQLMATVAGLSILEPTWWATIIGVGILLFTATTVLVTTQSILNRIFLNRSSQMV